MSKNTDVVKSGTDAERFVETVKRHFTGELGQPVDFTKYQQKLAQNCFIKTDSQLREFEAKRQKNKQTDKAPIVWKNVNLDQLAVDTVHRINLGLDALIPNHLHIIPYWNSALEKYDVELQPGYAGKHYYRTKMALEEPKNIIYELVHENDHFVVHKKNVNRDVESYSFETPEPFNRGSIKGGFGYIQFEDPTKNKLVVIGEDHFQKVRGKARTQQFWVEWPLEMRMKTLVHRTTEKLNIDPEKVNASYHYVEHQDKTATFGEEDDDKELMDIDKTMRQNEPQPEDLDPKNEIVQDEEDEDQDETPDAFDYETKQPEPDANS